MKNIKYIIVALVSFVLISNSFVNAQTTSKTEQNKQVENTAKKENAVTRVVSWYMNNINYGTITLLMAVESSFIPFPSEVVIPPAAYKALSDDNNMNIVLVVIFGTIGALIGAIFNYVLALIIGRPIVFKFAETRLGHMLLLSGEKVTKAEEYFVKHGKSSTFIGRLVPGVRQLISIPAGLARMNFWVFLLFTFLGAAIWNSILAVLGYLAKGQQDIIEKYSSELSYILLGLGILFVLYLIYNGIKKKKSTNNAK
jgi:membrane protein DedA with SNARE-associated domain